MFLMELVETDPRFLVSLALASIVGTVSKRDTSGSYRCGTGRFQAALGAAVALRRGLAEPPTGTICVVRCLDASLELISMVVDAGRKGSFSAERLAEFHNAYMSFLDNFSARSVSHYISSDSTERSIAFAREVDRRFSATGEGGWHLLGSRDIEAAETLASDALLAALAWSFSVESGMPSTVRVPLQTLGSVLEAALESASSPPVTVRAMMLAASGVGVRRSLNADAARAHLGAAWWTADTVAARSRISPALCFFTVATGPEMAPLEMGFTPFFSAEEHDRHAATERHISAARVTIPVEPPARVDSTEDRLLLADYIEATAGQGGFAFASALRRQDFDAPSVRWEALRTAMVAADAAIWGGARSPPGRGFGSWRSSFARRVRSALVELGLTWGTTLDNTLFVEEWDSLFRDAMDRALIISETDKTLANLAPLVAEACAGTHAGRRAGEFLTGKDSST